jgi:nucleoside-diphosphate-sugar epimerase
MPRILIAGCGYVGQATADLFHAAGWDVEGWTASEESAATLSAKPYLACQVDISNREQVAERTGTFDAVIHCASSRGGGVESYRQIYLNGARNLLDRFAETKVLLTSSTSVYAQRDGSWVTEENGTAGTGAARYRRPARRYLRPGQVGVTEQASCRHSNHRSGKRSLR